MSDRDKLLKSYIAAAHALAAEGLSGLTPEKARLVDLAMQRGAEVVLIYSTTAGTVTGALSSPDPDVDPIALFRIEAAAGATN